MNILFCIKTVFRNLLSVGLVVVAFFFAFTAGASKAQAVDLRADSFSMQIFTPNAQGQYPVDPGANVSFNYQVTNIGSTRVGPLYFTIYFSQDASLLTTQDFSTATRLWSSPAIWGTSNLQVFNQNTNILSTSFAANASIPKTTAPGVYYIYFFADSGKKSR